MAPGGRGRRRSRLCSQGAHGWVETHTQSTQEVTLTSPSGAAPTWWQTGPGSRCSSPLADEETEAQVTARHPQPDPKPPRASSSMPEASPVGTVTDLVFAEDHWGAPPGGRGRSHFLKQSVQCLRPSRATFSITRESVDCLVLHIGVAQGKNKFTRHSPVPSSTCSLQEPQQQPAAQALLMDKQRLQT